MKLGEWSHKSSGRGFAAAAVVGGTASALGGGKFANGALSGAFSFLFNYMSVERVSGPDYDPEVFGDDETNCVAYGMNARGTVRLGSNNTSMGELVEAAKALGMIEPYSNGLLSLPNGAIEVVIAPAQWTNTRYGTKIRDHHVFRRDSNGAYSHKFSGSRATNLDGSGNVIYNLRNANLTFRVPPRSGVTGYARGIRFDYEVQIDKAVTLWYVPR